MNLENTFHMIVNTHKYKIPHIYPNKEKKKNPSLVHTSLKENKIRELKKRAYFSQDNHFYKGKYFNFGFGSIKTTHHKMSIFKLKM